MILEQDGWITAYATETDQSAADEMECARLGWYCQPGHGPDDRWGAYCPCSKDDNDALHDLNRLAWYRQSGRDNYWDGCTKTPYRYTTKEDPLWYEKLLKKYGYWDQYMDEVRRIWS